MKRELLTILLCPFCKEKLHLSAVREEEGEVMEGTLSCKCSQGSPILNAIPRLFSQNLNSEFERIYAKTLKSFSFEWRRYEVQDIKTDQAVFVAKTGLTLGKIQDRYSLFRGGGINFLGTKE
jgi:uncharacterized protein YbaR (Trm112 family)